MKPTLVFLAVWISVAVATAAPSPSDTNRLRLKTAVRLLDHAASLEDEDGDQAVVCEEEAYRIRVEIAGTNSPLAEEVLNQMVLHDRDQLSRIESVELRRWLQAKIAGMASNIHGGDPLSAELKAGPSGTSGAEMAPPQLTPEMQEMIRSVQAQAAANPLGQLADSAELAEQFKSLQGILGTVQSNAVAIMPELYRNQGASDEAVTTLQRQFQLQIAQGNERMALVTSGKGTPVDLAIARRDEAIPSGEQPPGATAAGIAAAKDLLDRQSRATSAEAGRSGSLLENLPEFPAGEQDRVNAFRNALDSLQKRGVAVNSFGIGDLVEDAVDPRRWSDEKWEYWNDEFDGGLPLSQMLSYRNRLNPLMTLPASVKSDKLVLVDAILNLQSLAIERDGRLMKALQATAEPDVQGWASRIHEAQIGMVRGGAETPPSIAGQITNLQRMADGLWEERKLRILAQSLDGTGRPERIGWQDLNVPAEGTLVQFAVVGVAASSTEPFRSHYAVVVLPHGGKPFWKILATCEQIDGHVHELRSLLTAREATPERAGQTEQLLQTLHAELVGPWWSILDASIRDLYLVPDGELHSVPFACLLHDWEFLADRFTVRNLASCRALLPSKRAAPRGRVLEVWGNPNFNLTSQLAPSRARDTSFFQSLFRDDRAFDSLAELPGTETEAAFVAEIFSAKGYTIKKRTWNDASEAALRAVDNPLILHIGTHGIIRGVSELPSSPVAGKAIRQNFNSHFPFYTSALALSGASFAKRSWVEGKPLAPDNDGIFLAAEAARLRLDRTQLVVLSACDSGSGVSAVGEGLLGLKSAFFQAGAENVLLALWRVDDGFAPGFFRDFYRELAKNDDPSEALAVTQRKAFKELRGRNKGNLFSTVRSAGPFIMTTQ